MNAIDVYDIFAPFYDSYVGDFTEDIPLYITECKNLDPLVEIGCGSGRILLPLLENEHKVIGIDISPAMLSLSSSKLQKYINEGKLELLCHNLCNEPLPYQYPIILVTFYTFNYLLSETICSFFLKNAYQSLQSDGKIIIDLFYPQSLIDPSIDNIWVERTLNKNGNKITLKQMRHFENNIETRTQRFIDHNKESVIITERRFYNNNEIEELLMSTGFIEAIFTEKYDLSNFQKLKNSLRINGSFQVIARKQTKNRDG